ncbi:hypothetical protein FAGAP_13406 [Fusarium agapanthi]|uniref:Uncharacterized protein n=1 Tax=Fusarium agapanthi TaxID=1803897 RepID=A0A9P5AY98_9HYPO|nr:hypothetical protein FAGAP_13406 [Fusarium agapanthi]
MLAMSDVISVRLKWRLLEASRRVYNAADTFPSADDVRSGRFGSQSEHDKTQLEGVIEHLRTYFELNIPGQDSLDIGKFSSHVADWESLSTSLGVLLDDLEDLVHKDIFDEKRIELTMGSDRLSTLSGFPKLVALWEALNYRERPQTDDKSSNDHCVLADDGPAIKDDNSDEVNYELHDLDEEDMKGLTIVKDEDEDEAWVLPSKLAQCLALGHHEELLDGR